MKLPAAIFVFVVCLSCAVSWGLSPGEDNEKIMGAYLKWQTCDFSFYCNDKVDNPFAVSFGAELSGPGGVRFEQPGFYDGDGVWKVRVRPGAEGQWTIKTKSGLAALDKQSRTFVCGGDAGIKGNRGALRVDKKTGRHFAHEDGTPFFLMGYECDWLWALDMGKEGGKLEPFLDKLAGYGFNYIILNAYAHDTDWRKGNTAKDDYGPPAMYAWAGSNDKPDHSRFNLAYWQHYDKVIDALNRRGMVAHIMIKVYNKKVNWPANGSVEEDRYFRWLIARYAAYPNVHWDFSKEAWKETDADYKIGRVKFIKENDAYRCPMTLHDEQAPGKAGAGIELLDYCSDQSHGGWHEEVLKLRKQRVWPVVMVEFGYEHGPGGLNDRTWGMATTPEELCRRAWEIYLAGGYGVYYYTYTGWDMIRTEDTPPGYGYFKNLAEFFKTTSFETLQPADELVGKGYCLANRGREYVVFQNKGGAFSLKLEGLSGTIASKWYNPLTGEYRKGPALENGTVELVPPEVWGDGPVVFLAQ